MAHVRGAVRVQIGAPGQILEHEIKVGAHEDHELGGQREERLGDGHGGQGADEAMRAGQAEDGQAIPTLQTSVAIPARYTVIRVRRGAAQFPLSRVGGEAAAGCRA